METLRTRRTRGVRKTYYSTMCCVFCVIRRLCLSCEENDISIRFSRDGKPYDSTTYFARVRSIFSLLLLLLLLLYYVGVAVAVTAAIKLGCTTRLFLLRPVSSRGTSQTPRETLSRLARRVRPRVRTRLISPCYKIYLLSDQIGLE